jgi:OOP family OmpA-OmpF porin
MTIFKTKKFIVCATAVMLASGAFAVQADDDTGWYAGIGWSRLDGNFKDVDDLDFDDSDDTFQIKGGYMFTDVFGIEAGWLDLGDYRGGSGIKIDADAFWLAGVANWSVAEQFDLYAKLGAFFVEVDSDQVIPGRGAFKENETETELGGGVGAEWDLV